VVRIVSKYIGETKKNLRRRVMTPGAAKPTGTTTRQS
jgi:hypothetical protein